MARSNRQQRLLRRGNSAQITLGVYKYGPISRVQLARITGLSLACVSSLVDELLNGGALVETGTARKPRGRPEILLAINPDGAPVAGVYLSPESTEVVIVSPSFEILSRGTLPCVPENDDPKDVAPAIADEIRRCMEIADKRVDSLSAIGVTVAAIVDPLTGTIERMLNRSSWERFSITQAIEDNVGVPTFADNDVRAAALSFECFRDKVSQGTALYVMVADGIGAAVVRNGETLRGDHDFAGYLGSMIIDDDGPLCGCGSRGCLESLAADIPFIRRIWPEESRTVSSMTIAERTELVRHGLAMALRGDDNASRALSAVTKYLGIAIANVAKVIDPAFVFICGTMIDAEPDVMADLMRKEVLSRLSVLSQSTEINVIRDYNEFLLRGSAGLALWQPYQALQDENASARLV